MALEKIIENDKIEIAGSYKALQLREATIIKEDGVELSRTFHRKVLQCCYKDADGNWQDTDTSSETQEVQDISAVVWTDAVKLAYQENFDRQENLGD
jgi:hypothetical protein